MKVEKGVPIPDFDRNRRYPFHEMEVGDSFQESGGEKERRAAAVAARTYGGKRGQKYTTRVCKETATDRVWRVQ
jgi:hypothetical protein